MCPKFNQFIGIWSLDWMALDRNTRSKVFVNFGTRSNAIFGTRLKVLLIECLFGTGLKVFINFVTRSKVLIMVFLAFKTFDLVPKLEVLILALDQKF